MKLFTRLFLIGLLAFSIFTLTPKTQAVDIADVHQWLFIKGMTKFDSVEAFRANDKITRGEASKFITQYAKVLNMGKTYTQCDFTDVSGYDYTLVPFIQEVCAYGLIKGSQGKYMPNGNLTEAQALAIVIRSLEGFKDETKSPWYIDYYTRGQVLGLIENETVASVQSTNITRGKLGTWLFLAYAGKSIPDPVTQNGTNDTPIGVSMQVVQKNGSTTDISGQVPVEVEREAKITGFMDYDEAKLQKALSQGQQVVLYFSADRCPLCRTLTSDIEREGNEVPANLVIFDINYDTAVGLKSKYGVNSQHTLIYLDSTGGVLYTNVKKEIELLDIVTVIVTQNGGADMSIPTI